MCTQRRKEVYPLKSDNHHIFHLAATATHLYRPVAPFVSTMAASFAMSAANATMCAPAALGGEKTISRRNVTTCAARSVPKPSALSASASAAMSGGVGMGATPRRRQQRRSGSARRGGGGVVTYAGLFGPAPDPDALLAEGKAMYASEAGAGVKNGRMQGYKMFEKALNW
jgi:hypothetical protein